MDVGDVNGIAGIGIMAKSSVKAKKTQNFSQKGSVLDVSSGADSKSEKTDLSKIVLPEGYHPSEDEPFMCDQQLAYFRKKLLDWKKQLLNDFTATLKEMPGALDSADSIDVASTVMIQSLELRTRDRERKLIYKIDEALQRIEDRVYGYCEETGDPISLKRLEARPTATLSIEAQERHERKEREFSETNLETN